MTVSGKRGVEVLRDPSLNKSTAFSEAEKKALGLIGLVPDVTETEDLQLRRVNLQLAICSTTTKRCSTARSCQTPLVSFRLFMTRRLAKPA
jgi:hypothetical protein